MDDFNYSIAIRTTGKGGDKYSSLLKSIDKLEPKPQNVYVVLPENYTAPSECLGYETYVFSKKGMMSQRIKALDYCQSEYILFCDDDITFDKDFVLKLYVACENENYDIVTGELLTLLPKKSGIKHILPIITASAIPTLFHKDRYVTVLRSTGYSYNRFVAHQGMILPTQSAAGAVVFAKINSFKKIFLDDELWAQHDAFAPAEDQIMFYKANCIGLKVGVATDAHYNHLDAKLSVTKKEMKIKKRYWSGYNRYVFWYRFIYSREKNIFGCIVAIIAFRYYRISGFIFGIIRKIFGTNDGFLDFYKGLRDGKRFIKSEDYKKISKIQ